MFKPAHPWLTSNMLWVHVHRTCNKLKVISKHDNNNIQHSNNCTSNTSSEQLPQSPNKLNSYPIPSTIYTHQDTISGEQIVTPILTQDECNPNPNHNSHESSTNTNIHTNPNPIHNSNVSTPNFNTSPNESSVENVSNPIPNKGGRPVGNAKVRSATDMAINKAIKWVMQRLDLQQIWLLIRPSKWDNSCLCKRI